MASENLTSEQIRAAVAQGVVDGNKQAGTGGGGFSGKTPTPGVAPAVAATADTALGKASGMVADAMSNATPSIGTFSTKLGQLAGDLTTKGIGQSVQNFGGIIDTNINIFRTLSGNGIDLGNSIMEAQLAAGRARLPLDIFGKRIQENSQLLAVMGGSASQGAEKFASVSGKVMDAAAKPLSRLGFSIDEMSSYTATYMEMTQRSGQARKMSDDQLAAGAVTYNLELDKLAKATGISRKALDEQNAAAARDLRMRNAMQALMEKDPTGKLAAEVQAEIARLKQADPSGKLAAGMVDSITAGGNAITKEARDYQLAMRRNGQDGAAATRAVFQGQADSVSNLRAANDAAAASAKEKLQADRNLVGVMTTQGKDNVLTQSANLAQLESGTKAVTAAQKEQADKLASQDPTRKAAELDVVLTDVQNSMKKSLIDSGVFDFTAKGLNAAGVGATNLATEFSQLNNAGKLTAILGPAVAGAIVEGMAKGGLMAYGAKKGYDYVNKDKTPKTGDVDTPDKKPGAPDADADKKPGGKGKILTPKNIIKTVIIGGIAYYVLDIVDATTGADMLPTPFKKSEGERGVPLDKEKEQNRQSVLQTAPGLEDRLTGKTSASSIQSPTVSPSVLAASNQMTNTTNENLNAAKNNAQALNDTVRSTDFSKLMLPENVTVSLENGNTKLRELKTNIVSTTMAFSDLNNISLDKLGETINKLNNSMAALTQQVSKPIDDKTQGNTKAADSAPANKEMVDLLNQLNMNMGRMVSHQSDAVDFLSKTAKNTRNSVGNMLG